MCKRNEKLTLSRGCLGNCMTEVIRKVFLQIEKLCLSLRAEFLTEISDHFVNKCPLGVTNDDDDDDGNKQMNCCLS